MGRIIASVEIENVSSPDKRLRCDALVDTGASHMVLPSAWRERLGELEEIRILEFETATRQIAHGRVCGPVRLRIEGFRPIFTEVLFVDMEPVGRDYEALIGYVPLAQSQAAADMLGHRLVFVEHLDLK